MAEDRFSYEAIQPLIVKTQPLGQLLHFTFRCPVTGKQVGSAAPPEQGRVSKIRDSAKRGLFSGVRRAISRAVYGALSGIGGTAGYMARDMAGTALSGAIPSGTSGEPTYSEAEKNEAAVAAFRNVVEQFTWEDEKARWISLDAAREQMGAFARQLADAPIEQAYDKGVMARMLVEIASVDGTVADEEKTLLAELIPAELGSVDQLAARPKLSPVELSECATGASRDTLLMLAWSVALADDELGEAEAKRIDELTQGLEISTNRAAELKHAAQLQVFEAALPSAYPGGKRDEEAWKAVSELATAIGLEATDAERADIRYRKRIGCV